MKYRVGIEPVVQQFQEVEAQAFAHATQEPRAPAPGNPHKLERETGCTERERERENSFGS